MTPRWKRLLLLAFQPHEVYLRLLFRAQNISHLLFDLRTAGRSLEKRKNNLDPVTGSYDYTASRLSALQEIARHVTFHPEDVFTDVGCGRGRVLLWAAHKLPVARIHGIELDSELAAEARYNTRKHARIEVIEGDASRLVPPETTVLFMFNPFGRAVTTRLREQLESFPDHPNGLRVIYLYPVNGAGFKQSPHWKCEEFPYPAGWVSRYNSEHHWSNHRPWFSVFTRIPRES